MARSWLIDSRGFARKVKSVTQLCANQIKDCGASRECPNCHHRIDNSDVSVEWPGLPAGVKFDPSDVQLLEHLAGKVGYGDAEPHLYIDEFIPTLEGDQGICYTHPENLPGAKKDGNNVHFFHRTAKAYATGQRKRRKIHGQSSSTEEQVRWHKTGKTKPVIENGTHKGFKKIMVLYKSSKKGFKPDKSNWVMHQYHLGTKEDETDSGFVVSKIFYQQQSKQTDKRDLEPTIEESVSWANRVSPTTPNTYTPHPPRPRKRGFLNENDEEDLYNSKCTLLDQIDEEHLHNSPVQVPEPTLEATQPTLAAADSEDEQVEPICLAGESQPVTDLDNDLDTYLFCNEIPDYSVMDTVDDFRLRNGTYLGSSSNKNEMSKRDSATICQAKGDSNIDYGVPDLDNLHFDSLPDFDLANLPFCSPESFAAFYDRISQG